MGWTEGDTGASASFVDCIFAPSEVTVSDDGSATFSRGRNDNSMCITVENSYYTQCLGTMPGEMAYTAHPTNVTTVAMTSAGVTVYVKKTLVSNLAATNITPVSATVSWTGTETCSNYKVRYRTKEDPNVYSTNFEGGMPEGWTTFGNDGDEYNWTYNDGTKRNVAHSGYGCMSSACYINNVGALKPDNWLVTPWLDLGGTMTVWLKGQNPEDFREHFAIYLYQSDTEIDTDDIKSKFVDADGNLQSGVETLVSETEVTNDFLYYIADLINYNGKSYVPLP